MADDYLRERYPARRHLPVCAQYYFLSADSIFCLFLSGTRPQSRSCVCKCACFHRHLSHFDQTEFWSGFAFCVVANHCPVLAEWLVVAKGLVFSGIPF